MSETIKSIVGTVKNIADDVDDPSYDIAKFKLSRILQNNTVRKNITLLGTFPDQSSTDLAIIVFEKEAFTEDEVATNIDDYNNLTEIKDVQNEDGKTEVITVGKPLSYFNKELKVHKEFINNIYGSFKCVPSSKLNGVKTTVVYPASEKHIEKYSICQKYLIAETCTLYENLTLPYIKSSQFSLEWVYNILEHEKETERIVYEDPDTEKGFVLLPDLKWDGCNIDTLYLLAIIHQRNIKSLRDLTAAHLPLLRNIRLRAAEAIALKYSIAAAQLRMYFHYQPSFYHLHVHINPIRSDAPGIWCEKSHMLDTVINNIEMMSDYYQRATLPFVLYDGSKLFEEFEKEVALAKRVKISAYEDNEEKADGD